MLVISRKVCLRQTGSCSPFPLKSLAKLTKPMCCGILRWSWFIHTCSNVHFPHEQAGVCCLWTMQPLIFSASQVFHFSLMKHALIGSRLQASTCEPRARGRWVWMQSLVLDSVLELNSLRWSQTQSFFIGSFSFFSATLATEFGQIQSWAPCWPDLWLKFCGKWHKSGEESFPNQIKVGCNWVDARWSYWEARGESVQVYMNRWNTKLAFLILITWLGA